MGGVRPGEGEDGPLALDDVKGVVSDRAGAGYVTTPDSVLHVSAAGRVRRVATVEDACLRGIAINVARTAARCLRRTLAAARSGGSRWRRAR